MKIKCEFEPEDFRGGGQYIIANDSSKIEDDGYLSTIAYKAGYDHSQKHNRVCLIACCDGMIAKWFDSDKELCDYLNKNAHRAATEEELIRVVKYQGNRFSK
jgi:hypothetical protein